MLDYMLDFFFSWFADPSLLGIGLAILFGAIWLSGYWPPLFKKHWLWAVLVGSAFLSLVAVTFVQIPLQVWTGRALLRVWKEEILMRRLLLFGIPQILLTGLVQEGSKLVPLVVYWWRRARSLDPKLGLAIGAVAGAGLGTFEAVWAHNRIFASGWSWELVQAGGFLALAGFWERFFAAGFHIAASALAGYGLARGWGWQFYLLAALLHACLNYGVVLLQTGLFTTLQVEVYAAVVAVLVTAAALRLRWRRPPEAAEASVALESVDTVVSPRHPDEERESLE